MKRIGFRWVSAVAIALVVALLVLAAPVSALAATQPDSPQSHAVTSNSSCVVVVHSGDTLFRIAFRFGVSIQTMMAMNRMSNANLIFVGQQLFVPCGFSINTFTPFFFPRVSTFFTPRVFPTTFPSMFPMTTPNMFPTTFPSMFPMTMPNMFPTTFPSMFPMMMPGMFP